MDYELLKDYVLCRGAPLSFEKKQELVKSAIQRHDRKYLGILYTFGGITPEKYFLLDFLEPVKTFSEQYKECFFYLASILPDEELFSDFNVETRNTFLHYLSASNIPMHFFQEIVQYFLKRTSKISDDSYFSKKNIYKMDFVSLLLQYKQYAQISSCLPELEKFFSVSDSCFEYFLPCTNPVFAEQLLKFGLSVDPKLYHKCHDERVRRLCFYFLNPRDYKDIKDKIEKRYSNLHPLMLLLLEC